MNDSFFREWKRKVKNVRASRFWRQVSAPPPGNIELAKEGPLPGEIAVTDKWSLAAKGAFRKNGPAVTGMKDLSGILSSHFGIRLRSEEDDAIKPQIVFELINSSWHKVLSRWDTSFVLDVKANRIAIRAPSEEALLQGSLYMSNYWRLRRKPCMPAGKRTIDPAVEIHLGADLWGGFCTTQAWIYGRESDTNFLEMARVGVNGVPIMAMLEDYIDSAPHKFRSLVNPQAKANRRRLAKLARQSARYGTYIFLMAYNPKLDRNHPVFKHSPESAGTPPTSSRAFQIMCTSDPDTRKFLVDSWASLFQEIPELGGMLAIVGGEGFYHCYMPYIAPDDQQHKVCPRCYKRNAGVVVAEFVNDVARGIRSKNNDARLITWPYSAMHWSKDRDQAEFIRHLDKENVIFQTEIDKDSMEWRPAGYGKYCWDYSASCVTVADRCRQQRKICKSQNVGFSCKLEINNSIECLSVPYIPILQNQLKVWENCRALHPKAIHSRWLFDGSCKTASEEIGYWSIWGGKSEFKDLAGVLKAIAARDFGKSAAPHVLQAWEYFSEAMRHHPCLDYYVGSYYTGPGQPLVLNPASVPANSVAVTAPVPTSQPLDPVFFGSFYWLWENDSSYDSSSFTNKKPIFYYQPGFRAIARKGANAGQDVGLKELKALADLWEKGMRCLEEAKAKVPVECRQRFRQEWILAQHLAYTWRSGANVEEFLRLRNTIFEFSGNPTLRSGHASVNMRDWSHMVEIAREELAIARKELPMIRGVDFLDLSLRLDMGTASLEEIMRAKIRQVQRLLNKELPAWRKLLLSW